MNESKAKYEDSSIPRDKWRSHGQDSSPNQLLQHWQHHLPEQIPYQTASILIQNLYHHHRSSLRLLHLLSHLIFFVRVQTFSFKKLMTTNERTATMATQIPKRAKERKKRRKGNKSWSSFSNNFGEFPCVTRFRFKSPSCVVIHYTHAPLSIRLSQTPRPGNMTWCPWGMIEVGNGSRRCLFDCVFMSFDRA